MSWLERIQAKKSRLNTSPTKLPAEVIQKIIIAQAVGTILNEKKSRENSDGKINGKNNN